MNISASVIRTITPILVGWALALAAKTGLHLTADTATSLIAPAVSAVYYAAVRWAETRLSPRFGWLLGKATAPLYVTTVDPSGTAGPAHAGATDTALVSAVDQTPAPAAPVATPAADVTALVAHTIDQLAGALPSAVEKTVAVDLPKLAAELTAGTVATLSTPIADAAAAAVKAQAEAAAPVIEQAVVTAATGAGWQKIAQQLEGTPSA